MSVDQYDKFVSDEIPYPIRYSILHEKNCKTYDAWSLRSIEEK